jgi:flagellar biosynthesis/type III secretory pathway protein FliH
MIELPKFKAETYLEKKMTVLWLRFLKEIEDDKYIEPAPELMENEYVRKAIDLCEFGAFTDAELEAYDKYWDAIRIEKSLVTEGRMEGLKEGLEKGRQEGLEEGLEKGLEKGREEGLEEGLKEGLEKGLEKGRQEGLETFVINSFKNGLSVEIISTITGESTDAVISILKRNNLL